MSVRDTPWPAGTPCWVDLTVADVDGARLFYEGLFGWSIDAGRPEFGGYAVCQKDGRQVAAIVPKVSAEHPSVWTTYLATVDVHASAARITENGGRLLFEPMAIMDLGAMALAHDPAGVRFGLWQAGRTTGIQLANEPGAMIWNEQLSTDWASSKAFYGSVLEVDFNDLSSDEYPYSTIRIGGRDVGGLGAAEQGQGSWSVYFAVENADQLVAQVVKLGGNVIKSARESPFGRIATVSDPEGAEFSVLATPAEGYDDESD